MNRLTGFATMVFLVLYILHMSMETDANVLIIIMAGGVPPPPQFASDGTHKLG